VACTAVLIDYEIINKIVLPIAGMGKYTGRQILKLLALLQIFNISCRMIDPHGIKMEIASFWLFIRNISFEGF
jgi:hypothetical protein